MRASTATWSEGSDPSYAPSPPVASVSPSVQWGPSQCPLHRVLVGLKDVLPIKHRGQLEVSSTKALLSGLSGKWALRCAFAHLGWCGRLAPRAFGSLASGLAPWRSPGSHGRAVLPPPQTHSGNPGIIGLTQEGGQLQTRQEARIGSAFSGQELGPLIPALGACGEQRLGKEVGECAWAVGASISSWRPWAVPSGTRGQREAGELVREAPPPNAITLGVRTSMYGWMVGGGGPKHAAIALSSSPLPFFQMEKARPRK